MRKNKLFKIGIIAMVSISWITPTMSVMANPNIQEQSRVYNQENVQSNEKITFEKLKQKSMSIEAEIQSEIFDKGYSSVEEYNNQIGVTIPINESVYYNNFEYYNTPLVETIENQDEKAMQIVLWAKIAWKNPWVRGAVKAFGKGLLRGAGAEIGSTIVNDTREVMKNGLPKVSTHSANDIVGYGKITSGGKVKVAQSLLREQGYNIAVDGIWGPASEAATKSFQRKLGMSADGLIGKHTWAYLIEYLK